MKSYAKAVMSAINSGDGSGDRWIMFLPIRQRLAERSNISARDREIRRDVNMIANLSEFPGSAITIATKESILIDLGKD